MITRIVRLPIQAEKAEEFLAFFENNYPHIRNFEGCRYLELFREVNFPNIFITYSKWETEQHLELYRKSNFFTQTWTHVKLMLEADPLAFSMTAAYPLTEMQPC